MAPAAALRALLIGILVASPVAFVLVPKTQRFSLRASVDERDASGETPLIKAAEAGDCDAVSSLLQQGADARAESYTQWSALHGAAESGCVECCRLLLSAGARIDARAKSGLTPAGIAQKYGQDAAFALLSQMPLDTYPVAVPETGGTIIITPCPGKRKRDLGLDLDHLKSLGAEAIVGTLAAKSFTQGALTVATSPLAAVQPLDVLVVQAILNLQGAHFVGLCTALRLLRAAEACEKA